MAKSKLKRPRERPSLGTSIAEKHRARLNPASDAKRGALFAKGMQLIYGNDRPAKTPVGSR